MLPELLILGGIGAGAAIASRVRERQLDAERARQAAALVQMEAMEASQRLVAMAWQARQAMHQAVIEEMRRGR